jgi:ABC-2 type transport system permease protein
MHNLTLTIQRELHRMISRRIYFAACIVLPLFSLVFMATIFGNGKMEDLPVGVVDADNSSASRSIIRMVEATPQLRIVRHYANETEARMDVQRKVIYGYLVIPSGYVAKVGNNEEVTLCYYYHNAMLSVGGELRSTFEQLLKQVSITPIVTQAMAVGEEEETVTSFLMPVSDEEFPIYSQNRNYTVYLSQPFFFVFLQILLLLVTVYALGSESKYGTVEDWLQSAGGDIGIAVIGKLLPYTCIFITIGLFANWVFFGWMKIPMPCSLWLINGVTALFICATQALALFLYSLFPVLGLIISVVSMIGSLGATLSGVTFPVSFMDTPVYAVSFLFPIRHYMEVVQSLLYTDGTFADVGMDGGSLLLFMLPPVFLLPRLKNTLITHRYEAFE